MGNKYNQEFSKSLPFAWMQSLRRVEKFWAKVCTYMDAN